MYKVYPARWLLLIAVTLLNLANYSHWVAFASVAKQAADYYQVTGPEVSHIKVIVRKKKWVTMQTFNPLIYA